MNLPKNKMVLIGGAGLVAAAGIYVYKKKSSSAAAASTATTVTDPSTGQSYPSTAVDPLTGQTYGAEIAAYGSVSAAESNVAGQQAATYNYAGGGATSSPGGQSPALNGTFTSDAQWSQQAYSDLNGSGAYASGDILGALGAYLDKQPLTPAQATIVQAAIAIEGQPPVGTYSLIPVSKPPSSSGGGSPAPVKFPAPSGLHTTNVGSTAVTINWKPVTSGTHKPTGYVVAVYQTNGKQVYQQTWQNTDGTIGGLHPKWTYHINVWATGGSAAPSHATTTFTTKK